MKDHCGIRSVIVVHSDGLIQQRKKTAEAPMQSHLPSKRYITNSAPRTRGDDPVIRQDALLHRDPRLRPSRPGREVYNLYEEI